MDLQERPYLVASDQDVAEEVVASPASVCRFDSEKGSQTRCMKARDVWSSQLHSVGRQKKGSEKKYNLISRPSS